MHTCTPRERCIFLQRTLRTLHYTKQLLTNYSEALRERERVRERERERATLLPYLQSNCVRQSHVHISFHLLLTESPTVSIVADVYPRGGAEPHQPLLGTEAGIGTATLQQLLSVGLIEVQTLTL